MRYDFETVLRRYGMGSGKWEELRKADPNMPEDVIPFSVADMEFVEAPEIDPPPCHRPARPGG